jgi:WD40 repeat protein
MKLLKGLALVLLFAGSVSAQQTPQILTGHTGNINTIQFSPDGKALLSGCQDGTLRMWNADDHFSSSKILTIGSSSVKSICFAPDGHSFSVSTYGSFIVYKYPQLKKTCAKKKAHTTFVECANFSNDGTSIVSTSWRDNCLSLWDTKSLKKVRDFNEPNWTRTAVFLPGNNAIASGNHENNIRIWNVANGSVERTLAGHTDWVESLFVTKDGKYLVSGSMDKTIRVWDLATGKLFKTLTNHQGGVNALAISPDGNYFASSSLDKTIKLWNATSFEEITSLDNQENIVLCLAFSPDGKLLASSGMDKTIKVWTMDALLNR